MKKLLLIFSFILLGFHSYAQEQTRFVYCIIEGNTKFMSNKVTVRIDFGDNMGAYADNRMKDPKTGKPMVFNSMVDALNFMGKQGWEFVQAYADMNAGTTTLYHFLMKKPFSELDKETQMEYLKD